MSTPSFYIYTYGCQMNVLDTEMLANNLLEDGFNLVDDEKDADIILLNTCSVRETAETKVAGRLGHLKALKKKKPDLIVGLTGCWAQKDNENLVKQYPQIDLVLGTRQIDRISPLVREIMETRKAVVAVGTEDDFPKPNPAFRLDKLKAFISIMRGCNCRCAFCIVPYTRGREVYQDPEVIYTEACDLAEKGYKEITLLGQTVNSYRYDDLTFGDLLEKLCDIDGLRRIRYTSPHPRYATDRLIEVMAEQPKVCSQIHLPVQAGSNDILKKMYRGYTRERYFEIVDDLREKMPEVGITTDIIVAFPGETEADFEETLDLVRRVRFDGAFTFAYSPRSGTPAADMAEELDKKAKNERLGRLIEVQEAITWENNKAQVDKTLEVLFEAVASDGSGRLTGRSECNRIVFAEAPERLIGQIVPVKINRAAKHSLFGELAGTPV